MTFPAASAVLGDNYLVNITLGYITQVVSLVSISRVIKVLVFRPSAVVSSHSSLGLNLISVVLKVFPDIIEITLCHVAHLLGGKAHTPTAFVYSSKFSLAVGVHFPTNRSTVTVKMKLCDTNLSFVSVIIFLWRLLLSYRLAVTCHGSDVFTIVVENLCLKYTEHTDEED